MDIRPSLLFHLAFCGQYISSTKPPFFLTFTIVADYGELEGSMTSYESIASISFLTSVLWLQGKLLRGTLIGLDSCVFIECSTALISPR